MSGYRPPYTHQEELDILNYIIEHKAYDRLRGKALWVEMEEAEVGKDRTHHSLKEHFRKYMASRLTKSFYEIDDAELKKIRLAYQSTSVGTRAKTVAKNKGRMRRKEEGVDLNKSPPSSDTE